MSEICPKVSCLIPVYNAESYLEEALKSILNQSFEDWEMIVVNDGSSDRSLDIINDLARFDPRIIIINQQNSGIVAALNNGLKQCRGEYVARMDADDFSFTNRFSDQVNYLDTHPSCVCVGGFATEYMSATTPGRTTTGGRHRKSDLTIFPPKVAVAMHPLIMVRRKDLTEIGGYRAEYPHAEDYDLYIRLAERGSIDNPEIPMLFYRRHAGAVSIKHLELQERSAVMAEVDGYERATGKRIHEFTIQTYECLRIWRRYASLGDPKARLMLPEIIWYMVRILPLKSWTTAYSSIRVRIAANLVRIALRSRPRTS